MRGLEYVDALLYRSCRTLVDHAGADALCLTFAYRDRDGEVSVDLCPGGADRDVDDGNKDDFADGWLFQDDGTDVPPPQPRRRMPCPRVPVDNPHRQSIQV